MVLQSLYNIGDAAVVNGELDPDDDDMPVPVPASPPPPVQIGDTHISVDNLAAYIDNKMTEPDPFKSEYTVCIYCFLIIYIFLRL